MNDITEITIQASSITFVDANGAEMIYDKVDGENTWQHGGKDFGAVEMSELLATETAKLLGINAAEPQQADAVHIG